MTRAKIEAHDAWRSNMPVFDETPLSEIVEEFNRFNRRKLEIADPSIGNVPIGGRYPRHRPVGGRSGRAAALWSRERRNPFPLARKPCAPPCARLASCRPMLTLMRGGEFSTHAPWCARDSTESFDTRTKNAVVLRVRNQAADPATTAGIDLRSAFCARQSAA
jgi:hypothetical protein